MKPIVAIDGPAGSGKSTASRGAARELGYLYIDTGAMYRAAALAAQRAGLDLSDDLAVSEFCRNLDIGFGAPGSREDGSAPVLLAGEDVSDQIRTREIAMMASDFSQKPALRKRLTAIQRSLGASGGVVMEGRDIGTVVFPEARAKFFVSASPAERARRRCEELQAAGQEADLGAIEREIRARDAQDAGRAHAPLKKAADAEEIDSTAMSIEDVIARIVARVKAIEGS
ncbi:MAG: (d)CMP kinase [Chrysiogenetes bacterium]|nr:(d)CMP kinase [Chrysiogenetes bacterium]